MWYLIRTRVQFPPSPHKEIRGTTKGLLARVNFFVLVQYADEDFIYRL